MLIDKLYPGQKNASNVVIDVDKQRERTDGRGIMNVGRKRGRERGLFQTVVLEPVQFYSLKAVNKICDSNLKNCNTKMSNLTA